MTLAELRALARRLGFGIRLNKRSSIDGCVHKYRTAPIRGGGSSNYFNSKKDLELYLLGVEKIQSWQIEK